MPIDFDDDLAECFSEDDHGIVFTHNGRTLRGILNQEYVQREVGHGGVEGFAPVLFGYDLADLFQDDTITLEGKAYVVMNNEKDNAGLFQVILHES
jgi:hypothetical protein